MALLALTRKKQALAPDVRELVKSLTGFEREEDIRECENYVFSHFLHYQQPMVDGLHVQRSIDGLTKKFTVHGFPEKGKRLKTLVDNFIASSLFKQHTRTGVEWYVLQLMVNLAYKPTHATVDDHPQPLPLPAVSSEESFDWGAYLKEGWEKFQLPEDDESSDELWSIESDLAPTLSPEEEADIEIVSCKELKLEGFVPGFNSSIPNPSTWKKKPRPVLTKQEAIITMIKKSEQSEAFLKDNIQNSWWKDSSYKESVRYRWSGLKFVANFSEIWENSKKAKNIPTTTELLVISEYKVLREILWMFQVPANTHLFSQDENSKFKVIENITIPSMSQESMHLVLTDLCHYFDKIYDLKMFREDLTNGEESDKPPPNTYHAFCSAIMEEFHTFTELVVQTETKVNKQDQCNTIISVMADLDPALRRLTFLHKVFKTCITDWRLQPYWVCSTRLLSLLFGVLVTLSDNMQIAIMLHLFIASFSVYLYIIDAWLSEGRLEDWRQEFIVCRNGEELDVMPYEIEMKKYGIAPVSFLSKLEHMVRDAGRSMSNLIKLDKLIVFRESVHNKGNLYKEFVENVHQELENYHVSITSLVNADYTEIDDSPTDNCVPPNDKLVDLYVRKESLENDQDTNLSENNASVECINIINKSNVIEQSGKILVDGNEMAYLLNKETKPTFVTINDDKVTVDKAMYESTMEHLLDSPFLAEVFKQYFQNEDQDALPDEDEVSIQFHSHRSAGILDMIPVHRVLQNQLGLIYNRHTLSAKIVTETLVSEYRLIQHFIVLRKVLLMESGNIIQNFYSYLFKEMANKDWRNARGLTMQLVLSIEEEHPELGANFSVIINDDDSEKSLVAQICDISIGYNVEWPVNMVISADTIARYNSVFSFLLCIKYAFWSLYNLRFSDFNKTIHNTLKVRRLFVLKMWIQHCVTAIHFYFMGHVLHSYATELEVTAQQAEFVDDIINAHNKFLNAVQEHCLQESLFTLKKIILQILELCPMLESLWRLQIDGNLKEDDVAHLEDNYMKRHHALHSILELIKENSIDLSSSFGHLSELSSEISASLPESHYDFV